jgi:hypothetical protein
MLPPSFKRGLSRLRSNQYTYLVIKTTIKRHLLKCLVGLFLFLLVYQLLWTYWLAGVGVPDVEMDFEQGIERVRRRPDRLKKVNPQTGRQVAT